jgi:hypothetical protein
MARSISIRTGDLVYDSFYSGAVGGSVVALFFLLVDALQGQPLFTPSLLGSVLFEGISAERVSEVRLDMVSYYTVVHFAVFAVVGTTLSFLFHEAELHARNPIEMLVLLVLVLEGAFFVGASLALPGVIDRLGAFRLAVGNLLAGGAMVVFLLWSHRRAHEEAAEPR